MQLLFALLSLLIASTTACDSFCICQKPDGKSNNCIVRVTGWNQHGCEGYCHDRNCAGITPHPTMEDLQTCRIWKGFCKVNGDTAFPGLTWCEAEDPSGKPIYNACPKDFDCPY